VSITKIVSGGQSGADIGGLDAAIHCDLPHGGWCPKGRRQEKGGVIPDKYMLTEMPSRDWAPRTEANVVDSSCTLVCCSGEPTGGSALTVKLAKKHGKPVVAVDLDRPRQEVVDAIVEWLKAECPDKCVVLNVAGSRESKSPGIGAETMQVMVRVINKCNGVMFYPPFESNASRWLVREAKRGDVVMLSTLVSGHEPGPLVFTGKDGETLQFCRAGEDPESGNICETDEKVTLPMRAARLLKPTGLTIT